MAAPGRKKVEEDIRGSLKPTRGLDLSTYEREHWDRSCLTVSGTPLYLLPRAAKAA
jgi:hypothetical protein